MKQQLPIIDCDHCGACCLHIGHPPFIPYAHDATHVDPAYLELPPHLVAELAEYRAGPRYGEVEPCVWLDQDTMRCKHYAFRPTICREFQVGSDACRDMRWRLGRFNAAHVADR